MLPNRFLARLTVVNILVITVFILLSSLAIYNVACVLADGMVTGTNTNQRQFETVLFQYLMIFSLSAIVIGSFIHFYVIKKLIKPVRTMISSMTMMKQGKYPDPIEMPSQGEIGELNDHLNDLIRQLKANQSHHEKMVSDLSHEFRTPLSNLNGYLQALDQGIVEGNQPLYQSLYEESNRLKNLVIKMEQLKEWDYLSSHVYAVKEDINIHLLIEQTIQMFHWSLEQSDIQVERDIEAGTVQTMNGGISQVVSNLLDNAIQYYEGETPIQIVGKNKGLEYHFSISGPGKRIVKKDKDRVFDRLYRVDPSRSKDSGGSGLGLAISKEIIEHHQGQIGLETDGHYHTFWFTLPISVEN